MMIGMICKIGPSFGIYSDIKKPVRVPNYECYSNNVHVLHLICWHPNLQFAESAAERTPALGVNVDDDVGLGE